MQQIRKSNERGGFDHGWLKTKHTFSFGDYHDPKQMGFSVLRVINEDKIAGGEGFPTHGHKDMEIITYIVSGALEHKDSMGTSSVIYPGDVQRMSAGVGVRHSEFNHLKDQDTHLLQIWVLPDKENYKPSYAQKNFADSFGCSDFVLVTSPLGRDGSINLNQDVDLYVGKNSADAEITHKTFKHRKIWIQLIAGSITANKTELTPGDGLGLGDLEAVQIKSKPGSEYLLFDLPQ